MPRPERKVTKEYNNCHEEQYTSEVFSSRNPDTPAKIEKFVRKTVKSFLNNHVDPDFPLLEFEVMIDAVACKEKVESDASYNRRVKTWEAKAKERLKKAKKALERAAEEVAKIAGKQ